MLYITNKTRIEQEISENSCQGRRTRMEKDFISSAFFSDNERYADIINGIGCNGIPLFCHDWY